jgi:hypothetical protein
MNRTTAWIFALAVGSVSLLELALAVLNYRFHGAWVFVIGPVVLALGLGLQAFAALLRKGSKPAAPRVKDVSPYRRLAGPGRTFRRS